MSRRMRGVLVLLVGMLGFGLAACGSDDDGGGDQVGVAKAPTTQALVGREFLSTPVPKPGIPEGVEYMVDFSKAKPALSEVKVEGKAVEGEQFSAGTQCHGADGLFRVVDGRLETPFATYTGVGCGRAWDREANRFDNFLSGNPRVLLKGEQLQLIGRHGTMRFTEVHSPVETWAAKSSE